jgi:hypothetical protein
MMLSPNMQRTLCFDGAFSRERALALRIIVSTLGIIAALVMCAVSAAMNWLFLSSLGKSPLEGQVLGAASAAADVLKALLPFFIAWSWQAGRFVAAGAGSLAFVFLAGFSFLSAIGFAADNRLVLLDRRDDVSSAYARVQRDLVSSGSQRTALPAHRPPAVVAEEIERHRQNRRWTATKECTEATEPQSRDYCAAFFALRAELVAGEEHARLSSEIAALQSEAAQLRQQGAGQDRDPQATLLSRIFGWEQDSVRLALIIAVALLVEIGASLGLFLASGHRQEAAPVDRAPQREAPHVGSVEDFCLEALAASPRSALAMDELLASYQAWCARKGQEPLEPASFATAFTAIAEAVELRSGPAGYRGIELATPDVPALAA